MNSDHAPTAEEQLPPLDTSKWRSTSFLERAEDSFRQREAHLLAAIRENREENARYQILNDVVIAKCAEVKKLYAALAEKDARIAELEKGRNNLRLQAQVWAGECDTHQSTIQDCYKAVGVTGKCDFNGAEPVREYVIAAEAKLRAVSDALEKHGHDQWVHASVVGLFARIRAIVEGK